jgi:DNA polymerase III delta subunit
MLILHGENLVASRKRLKEEIDNFKLKFKGEVVRFAGNQLDLTQIKQAVESSSLFGQNRLIVIENLFSSPPSTEKQKIIDYLKQTSPKNLLIWERKKIDNRVLIPFKAREIKFDLTPIIFRFLDSLAPNNQKLSLSLLHQCLVLNTPEMVFYMLGRQIRLLIIAADLGENGLIEIPQWRQNKLISQAKKFGLTRLLQLYRQLLKIDWQQKTGQTPFDLTSQLDLFIASL